MQTEWTHRIWSDPVPSTSKKGKLRVRGARGRFKRITPREEERVDGEEPGKSEKTRDMEEENCDNDSSVEAAQGCKYIMSYILTNVQFVF